MIRLDFSRLDFNYLTIRHQEANPLGILYELSHPDEAVRQALSRQLLQKYTGASANATAMVGLQLQRALTRRDWDTFSKAINRTLASVPYQIFPEKEPYSHSLLHVMLIGTVYRVASEVSSSRGWMDTMVELPEQVFIFEFKPEGTLLKSEVASDAQKAIEQIKDEGYARHYSQPVTLVGVVFDPELKQVGEWVVEQYAEPEAAQQPTHCPCQC